MNSSPAIKIHNSGFSGFQTEIPPNNNILPGKIKKSGFYIRPIRNDFFLRAGRAVQNTVGFKPAKQSGKGNNNRDDALLQKMRNFLNIKKSFENQQLMDDNVRSTPESLTHYFNLRT